MSESSLEVERSITQTPARDYCEVCRSYFYGKTRGKPGLDRFIIHPASLLKNSAKEGCLSCTILIQGIELFRDLDGDDYVEMSIAVPPNQLSIALCLGVITSKEDLHLEFDASSGKQIYLLKYSTC